MDTNKHMHLNTLDQISYDSKSTTITDELILESETSKSILRENLAVPAAFLLQLMSAAHLPLFSCSQVLFTLSLQDWN